MPYIRYRGGNPPRNAREIVRHFDRSAACYEGLDDLVAAARRHAEETIGDAQKRPAVIQEYIDQHDYPGLQRPGGVCFVDGDIRRFDEAITPEEYQQESAEIQQANQNYFARRSRELSEKNDAFRRAASEHEDFGWRTRVWVSSYTELEHHTAYSLGDKGVAYLRLRQPDPLGSTLQLIDIYHSGRPTPEDAIFDGIDWADLLVDILALTGYGAANLVSVVSTTVPYCEIGAECEIAVLGASIVNAAIPVRPDQFAMASRDTVSLVSLRHVRNGLSDAVPTLAFAAFWNALERQAEDRARRSNLKRLVTCPSCGQKRGAGWDLKQGFESMYADAGLDPHRFDEHRAKRSSIQHGGRLVTTGYASEVFRELSQVQIAAVVSVAKRVGISPGTPMFLSASWPVVVVGYRAAAEGGGQLQFKRVLLPMTANVLPQRVCGSAHREPEGGLQGPIAIDPLAPPPLAEG